MNCIRTFLNRTTRAGLAALVVLTALLASTTPARAAGITVDTQLDRVQTNEDCSLSEAILAANTDSAVDACPAGAGADTITFNISGRIDLVSALPEVTSTITIDGTGQNVTISGDNFTQVMQNSGTLHLIALTVADGNHGAGGGGIHNGGMLTVINSTFSDNSGTVAGGGIYNNGTLTVINSTFSGNSAQGRSGFAGDGGGIYNSGTLTVINSTFSGNSAESEGGGIFNATAFGGSLHLSNTIIADSLSGSDCVSEGNLATNVNNLIEDGSCNPAFSGDPMLGPLRDNGGDTHTMALLPGSAAIDMGDDAVCAAAPVSNLDQRGVTRPIDGDTTPGAACDIGAFEAAVLDGTPPVITPVVTGTLGSNNWYTSDVSVHWNVGDDGSAITSQTGCNSTTVNTDTAGVTLTCTATSDGGTASQSVTFKRDATPPVLNPVVSPNPVLLGGSATVSSHASDALSGLASESCGTLDTSTAGVKTVICTATDNAGNTATATASYQVAYNFAGFFSPVNNLPVFSTVKAGQAIPVKFNLGGNFGLNIFAAGHPKVQQIACDSGAPGDEVEETVASGNSGLQYDAASGIYTYVWKTQKSWAGTCRQLIVRLADGTDHIANFKFK